MVTSLFALLAPLAVSGSDPAALLLPAPALGAAPAVATPDGPLPYTWLEVGYGSLSGVQNAVDGSNPSSGFLESDLSVASVTGSYAVTDSWHVFGGLAQGGSFDSSYVGPGVPNPDEPPELMFPRASRESSTTSFVGVGWNTALDRKLSLFARASILRSEQDATVEFFDENGNPATYFDVNDGVVKPVQPSAFRASSTALVSSLGLRYLAMDSLELSSIALLSDESGSRVNLELSALYRIRTDVGMGLVSTIPGRSGDGSQIGFGLRWYF